MDNIKYIEKRGKLFTTFKVDHNTPVAGHDRFVFKRKAKTKVRFNHPVRFPWDKMRVGSSFFAPGYRTPCVYSATLEQDKKMPCLTKDVEHPDRRYTRRRVIENGVKGLRIWRIA